MVDRALDELRTEHHLGPRWHGTRNSWIKKLLPAHKGRVGEQLFTATASAAGCEVTPRSQGNDTTINGNRVEVKLATLHDNDPDDPDTVEWLQLRPGDRFDHIALLAVCPDHSHLWIVDRATALAHTTGHHGGKAATETRRLTIDPHCAPAWLGTDHATNPAALLDVLAPTTNGAGTPTAARTTAARTTAATTLAAT